MIQQFHFWVYIQKNKRMISDICTRVFWLSPLSWWHHTIQLAGSRFPNQGSNPTSGSTEVQSSNHWTTREFPTPVIIAAFFTKAKRWKPPKCAPVDEGIHQMHTHTTERYSVLRMKRHACTLRTLSYVKHCCHKRRTRVRFHAYEVPGTRLPWLLRQQRIYLQCGRPRFNPWVKESLWRRKWQPAPVFLVENSMDSKAQWGRKEQDTTKQLTLSLHRNSQIHRNKTEW